LEAQIEQTSSSLRAEEANLEFTRIYAPMDGTVVSLSSKQGQTLNANQQAPTILRIADLSVMTIKAEVSEADVMRLKDQMEVYFKTLGRDKKWFSKLRKVEPTPTITNNVVLYNALFDVDNKTEELMSEMTAQVFFVLAKAEDVLLLPVSAVMRENPKAKVAKVEVLLEDGSRERRDVELGVSNRVMLAIRSGVKEGERVIIPEKKKSKNERLRMPRMM
ncbi:MAG: efflux RND transporter periplasmic adaptor subunit, partial [Sulfurimonas sp.]|nr:efflux RND transporter periplasmic adaptor subunit [Sulfurimonas sp.]